MSFANLVSFIIYLLYLLITPSSQVYDDNCYTATFNEYIKDCDDFQNEMFLCNATINISSQNDDAEGVLTLSGEINLNEDIDTDYEVELKFWKHLGTGKQYIGAVEGNFCDSVNKSNTPWKPLNQALGATKCPIVKGYYPVANLEVSLEFAKEVITYEFCGDYTIEMTLKALEKDKACVRIFTTIEEVPCK